ncbi:hypothetical protein [Nakamurella aerolata]|uniref:DNA-binding transcriptional regulator of glucitol operon n=1 Tax=Nakamurella aerolata TaxID=1656892 RepID=A0A849AD28_9ACTN|nr:hypothetical protein [Nakamurella aerolata]NNG37643.1 hypothetical protein [Nakamurella aerolata]
MDRRFLKPGWLVGHLIMVAAVVVCVRLGFWQWHRSQETAGTMQNLAYAVLWPAFGLGFIYMWVRFLLLEKSKDEQDDKELDEGIASILDEAKAGDADGAGASDADPATGPRPVNGASPVPASGGAAEDHREPDRGESAHQVTAREPADHRATPSRRARAEESTEPATFVGYVPDVDADDDPELAAYNRALAALAEKDRRAH